MRYRWAEEVQMAKSEHIEAVIAEMSRVWGEDGLGGEKCEYEWLVQKYGITEEEDVLWQLILQDDKDDLTEEDLDDEELMTFLAEEPTVLAFFDVLFRKYQKHSAVYPR
jgi:hypothetical protein